MKKEFDDLLCTKYPKIFSNRNKSKFESCMYWGFECGNGWFDLIAQLCNDIQVYLDSNPNVDQVVADQVKSKFGTLSFYTTGGDEYTRILQSKACHDSAKICELCGSKENVTATTGWIIYLCENCMKTYLELKAEK